MGEELETIRETAIAVQEASKTGRAVVDATSELGRWTARVLGTVPEDLVGLALGDFLREHRIRNLNRVRQKTDEILRKRGVKEPEPIGPKVAIPAFEAASEETDEILQDLWARLLANAMDPKREIELQRILVDALKQFEPIDAVVFRAIAEMDLRKPPNIARLAKQYDKRETLFEISANRLKSIGCVDMQPRHDRLFTLNALGKELWLAIKDDGVEISSS